MSTPRVVAETLSRAREAGLNVAQLSGWYDVDVYADLQRLNRELRSLPRDRARYTRAFLEDSGIV
jgi:glycosyltransferase A (GT-A) superfamily protein (DUF2064 family)